MNSTSTTTYEMSKTYQYRKVMKPMLERKRRARINKCLDDLKDLIAECMQQQNGDANVKLEKADILELTVQHLRKIKKVKSTPISDGKESFRTGYIQAANEVSRCLASLPKVDIALGTQLMTHLGLRLNQLAAGPQITVTKVNAPLNVYCGGEISYPQQSLTMLSPVSSGYGSDSEYSTTSSSSSSSSSTTGLLMKVGPVPVVESGSPVWRPW